MAVISPTSRAWQPTLVSSAPLHPRRSALVEVDATNRSALVTGDPVRMRTILAVALDQLSCNDD